ncbi:MAG: DinB family protein [Armatimonadetes bacterium]|nr:DinB family protein [Armatimonadota bacterium]
MTPIDSARADLLQARDRILALLDATPDEKLRWRPSDHARSILEIAAHAADALSHIVSQMQGMPFAVPTSREADASFRARDEKLESKEQVRAEWERNSASYVAFLDSLSDSDLDRLAPLPFGLGEAPLRFYIRAGANHTLGHIAQIEYIQTLYGDHDWHTGF